MIALDDKPTLVDLFSGCGGLSFGFAFPGLVPTFRVLGGVDWDREALRTFKHNHPEAAAFCVDLRALTDSEIRAIARRIDLRAGQLDVLHASPPCQPFSANNRSASSVNGDAHLFVALIAWGRVLRPKAIMLENVVGMQRAEDGAIHEEFCNSLADLGYCSISGQVNAVDFGIPQDRVRLLYLAYRDDLGLQPRLPERTHTSGREPGLRKWVTVKDAIGDLPPRRAGQKETSFVADIDPLPANAAIQNGHYWQLMLAPKGTRVGHHFAPPLSERARSRIKALRPGEALEHLPNDLQPRMGYRGAYGRLHPKKPSSTITGNCDGPSRGRFSHYSQVRSITLREAARLQSFPDSFEWSNPSRTQVAQEIGNAVPPLLGHALARSIAVDLSLHENGLDASSSDVRIGEHFEVPEA